MPIRFFLSSESIKLKFLAVPARNTSGGWCRSYRNLNRWIANGLILPSVIISTTGLPCIVDMREGLKTNKYEKGTSGLLYKTL